MSNFAAIIDSIEHSLQMCLEEIDSICVLQLAIIRPTIFGYEDLNIIIVITDPPMKFF